MKKLFAIITALCLLFCLCAGCGSQEEPVEEAPAADGAAEEPAEDAPEETPFEDETVEMPVSIGQGGTGYESFPADMVVATVNGTAVTWMEYYYWLHYYTQYVVQLAAQYGMILTDWEGNDLSAENTNAQVVIMNAQANLIQDHVIWSESEKLGVTLDEEDQAELQAAFENNADQTMGNGDGEASEEEMENFLVYLQEVMNVDRDFFDRFNGTGILSEKAFLAKYGEEGARYSDEDTAAFAEENGLLGAKHILLLTVDADTREPLTDEEIAAKRVIAENLLAELQAVQNLQTDPAALESLFDSLMAEYTEDNGYASYPDGYVFSDGQMVQEFEDAVKALEIGQMSDIVESAYGYHIILRIPVEPDAVIGTDSTGVDVTLRYAAATQDYSELLSAWVDEADVVWSEGFETPDMAAIFG